MLDSTALPWPPHFAFFMSVRLAIKVDVDTDRGTREGAPALAAALRAAGCPATFLFSLGPDNTGKAVRRVFRPGFLKKIGRTNVAGNYGLRTLLSGTLLPAWRIGERNAGAMRAVRDQGFAVGIHCWDHFAWQDYLARWDLAKTRAEFGQAVAEFKRIFGEKPRTAGAPGWQATAHSFRVYDEAELLYGSDTRGPHPFFPRAEGEVFKTLQIPTTLPTLDELLGRPEFPLGKIVAHYRELLTEAPDDYTHVLTIHAELEGQRYLELFKALLTTAKGAGLEFVKLEEWAATLLRDRAVVPVCDVEAREIDGRTGTLAVQGAPAFCG
jgi:undecaprenyl phosphate-alpha-L-ara4FN deformylase